MSPAHRLFEHVANDPAITTIGIGDGGNEIGMGKIPWDTIRRNIPNGGLIACRVPVDHLIVAGVSNWGAIFAMATLALLPVFAVFIFFQRYLVRGLSFGAPTLLELEMAELLTRSLPSVEQVRLVSSGTEAVMAALRLARAA